MIGAFLRQITTALDMNGVQVQDAAGIIRMQRETLDFRYIEQWVETLQLHQQWVAVQGQAT